MLVRGQAGGHEACAEVCLVVSKIKSACQASVDTPGFLGTEEAMKDWPEFSNLVQ